jgi:ABC-type uncharacterized transport system permease subunit
MSMELMITLAAVGISILIFTWLIKVVKTTLSTAIKLAILAASVQIFLGIGPQNLWQHTLKLLQQGLDAVLGS